MDQPTPPPSQEPSPPRALESGTAPAPASSPAGPTIEQVLRAATPHVWVTPLLTGLVVASFGASLAFGVDPLSPTAMQVYRVGGSFGPALARGEWWRLLTSTFLHFGLIHLAFNTWAFWGAGQFTERLYGNLGFLAIYLLSAVGGALLGAAFSPMAVSAGASGAVFGVYGALMVFAWTHRGIFPPEFLAGQRGSLLTFLAYNLIYGVLSERVSLSAHAGGLVVGLAAGWLLRRDLTRPAAGARRRLAAVAALALALLLGGLGLRLRLAAVPEIRSLALAQAGGEASQAGRHEEAVARYGEALATGASWEIRHNRALELIQIGRTEEALRDATQAAAEAPGDEWQPLAIQGWLLHRQPDPAGTERACAELWRRAGWRKAGAQAALLGYCAEGAMRRRDLPVARQWSEALLQLAPGAPEPLRARASLRWEAGEEAGALADLEQLVAAGPGDTWALELRGWIRMGRGDFTGAREDADRALAVRPDDTAALGTRCFALAGLGDLTAARRDCARAAALHPPGHPVELGMLAFLDGDGARAVEHWTAATRASPSVARILAPWLARISLEVKPPP